ncbi:hypothetical protein SAMD00023378_3945 [Ralstonia sp. NT80]|uniref:hypothetical protein n=1 Tax=Ralstonia sp. NT80 TaxID=1218247 RepID=UPI00076EF802|nr:hypothetical protein [Ralstonia sp. NT80]GAQ30262.1 hypothetical protein SAMD00023378_3945 [Ralstonia sp. NT80]
MGLTGFPPRLGNPRHHSPGNAGPSSEGLFVNVIKRLFGRFRRQPAASPEPTLPTPRDHLDLMRHTYRPPEHGAAQRKSTTTARTARERTEPDSRRTADDSTGYSTGQGFVPLIIDDPLPTSSDSESCSRVSYDAPTGGGGSFSGAGASGDWSSSSSSYDSGTSSSDSSSSSSYD